MAEKQLPAKDTRQTSGSHLLFGCHSDFPYKKRSSPEGGVSLASDLFEVPFSSITLDAYSPRIPRRVRNWPASYFCASWRALQSRHHRVHGTASRRALLIGSPHSSQTPNFSRWIRSKASSMARKSLPSV